MQDIEAAHRLIVGSVRRNRDIAAAGIDGETFLMSIERGRYYALDAAATAVWQRLDLEPTGEALIAGLIADFQGDPVGIHSDVLALLHQWLEEGLVSIDA